MANHCLSVDDAGRSDGDVVDVGGSAGPAPVVEGDDPFAGEPVEAGGQLLLAPRPLAQFLMSWGSDSVRPGARVPAALLAPQDGQVGGEHEKP